MFRQHRVNPVLMRLYPTEAGDHCELENGPRRPNVVYRPTSGSHAETHMHRLIASSLVAGMIVCLPAQSDAKGCLKGAAVGGVAGHVAGHHAVIGAAAGCAIEHHREKVADKKAAQAARQAPANNAAAQPTSK